MSIISEKIRVFGEPEDMKKHLTEAQWEKKLNIDTFAARHEKDDKNHSRYEPTPYKVLERLSQSGLIGENDVFVDYGAGKGRVGFFMSCAAGCKCIGIEYDPAICQMAEKNKSAYAGTSEKVSFLCENAEAYQPDGADCFYFFNPFSVKILRTVLSRIFDAYYANPRRMRLFFYYALDSYLTELMNEPRLLYEGEIDVSDLFHNPDEKEKILIFSLEP